MKCKDCEYFNNDRRFCTRGCCYGVRDPEQKCVLKDNNQDKEEVRDAN